MRAISLKTILTSFVLSIITFSATADNKVFKVCADPLNPPFSSKNLDGFENKIAELFAKELGLTVEYTWFPQRIGFIRNTLKATVGDTDEYKCDIVMGLPAGYELTLTTKPYYHSTYVLIIAKNRGWDDIKQASDLANLSLQRQQKLRIAMFDRGPGTAWLQKKGLLEQGIPYQSMSGDNENNTAMQINKDLEAGKIDMVILWGPMAGYVLTNNPANKFTAIPMVSSPGMKFDFSIAMGVRYGDNTRKETLNRLIQEKSQEIENIMASYKIPLLPIPKFIPKEDNN